MSFYTPKTDDQLQSESLLPAGDYDFEVLEADERISKSNNPMLQLKLKIFGDDSTPHIFDYIVPSSNFGERKLKAFARSVGLEAEYESGNLTADICINTAGKATIGVQDASGGYDAKNVVQGLGYLESKSDGPF